MFDFFLNPGKFYNFSEKSHNVLKQITIYIMKTHKYINSGKTT